VGASLRCDSTSDSKSALMHTASSTAPTASKGRESGLGDGSRPDSASVTSAIGTRTQ
jgi:hypothetical protein